MGGEGGAPGGGRGGAGGGGSGGPGGFGGGGPGGGGPRARRDLTALIGKLALLTRGVQLNLDEEQKTNLASAIKSIDSDDEMTEEAAKELLDSINAILTSENNDVLASIELPRPARAGGAGGPGGMGGAMLRPPPRSGGEGQGIAPASSSQAPGGAAAGGSGPPSNENPFKQEDNAKRLNHLREQISAP
jgi:hypothetical protein